MSTNNQLKTKIKRNLKELFSKHKKLIILFIGLSGFLIFSFLQHTQVLPQKAISILSDIKVPVKNEKIIFIIPHADDEALACSGLIQRSIKNNANVYIVLVTDNNNKNIKNKRYLEFFNSINLHKIDTKNVFMLNRPDKKISQIDQTILINDLSSILFSINPDFVIYPSVFDTHTDHRAIGQTTLELLKHYPKIRSYSYLMHYKYFPRPMKYLKNQFITPPLSLLSFNWEWQKFMLTSKERDLKCEAIFSYKSQLSYPILKKLLPSFCRLNELYINYDF